VGSSHIKKMVKKNFALLGVNFASCYFWLWLGIVALPCTCFAQKADSIQKINQLNEVQIQQYRLTKQNLSPVPLQILSAQELMRINSLSVADAIRYFSGVQLKDYGGIGGLKTVNVRSMGSNHTAVFYDGIVVGNAQNGQVDLGRYGLDNLEEISLWSGQNSNLLQPAKAYASASAIFLKTKVPDFDQQKRYFLNADVKLGDFGLISPSVNYQYRIKDKLWGSISTNYIHANGSYKFRLTNGVFDTIALRNNADVERFRIQAALFGETKYKAKWNIQGYAFWSNRGLPGAIVANKFDYSQRIWDQNFFVQGAYRQDFNHVQLLFNAKFTHDYTRFVDPEYVKIDGFLDNRFRESEAYFSVAAKYDVNTQWSWSLSSDNQYQYLNANLYRFAYPQRNTFLNVLGTAFKTDRLTLQGNLLSTTVVDRIQTLENPNDKQIFSPTLMFSWKMFQEHNLSIRGFYKDIFRMPTFNDLYYTFIGNTLLRPEFTKQYDLGLTYSRFFNQGKLRFVELQGDVYYNTVKDKIIAQPGANLARWIMYNIGKVEVRGLEINAKTGIDLRKRLNLGFGINYTYQQAIDVTDRNEDSFADQIPYVPKHSGSFLAKVDYKHWKLNYSFIYTGYRYNQKANLIYNYMEPWYTHDMAMGYGFKLKESCVQLNFEINNLLNQYYDVIPNFPMPGRNYRLTLNYSL
jgi:vitamin B12 transporter